MVHESFAIEILVTRDSPPGMIHSQSRAGEESEGGAVRGDQDERSPVASFGGVWRESARGNSHMPAKAASAGRWRIKSLPSRTSATAMARTRLVAGCFFAGGKSSVELEAADVSLLLMKDESGWTGAKLSSHRNRRESSLWLTSGRSSIYRGPTE